MSAYLPSLLALAAAFLFAVSAHVQNAGLDSSNGQAASLTIVLTTAVLFWIVAPIFLVEAPWLSAATLLFALSGILRPTVSISLWTHGIRLLGPTLNAGLGSSGPIFAALFAFLIVGEVMTRPVAIGTGLVVAGILVAAIRGKSSRTTWPLWAIGLPIGAEACRAIAHSMTKVGFNEVPDPFFAALVATTTAAVLLFGRYYAQGRRLSFRGNGTGWFIVSGLINGTAIFVLNVALELGQVITVVPIVAISPVFVMLLGLFVFGRESFTWQTFLTIALVVPGV
ncbi:MAG: EamA family transporter, partial [Hyphomicrobiaceae bacterium]